MIDPDGEKEQDFYVDLRNLINQLPETSDEGKRDDTNDGSGENAKEQEMTSNERL